MPLTIFFSSPGTYTIADDGIRGNNTSVVLDASGTVLFPFVHPVDTLDFIAQTPGVHLVFDAPDSFGAANVTVGSLTDPNMSPDSITVRHLRSDAFVTLASNGSIREGGADAPADVIAAGLVLSAATGIGTGANAIETQVTFVEGETVSGGINLVNAGNVQVGGLTPEVAGLDVATSGNLTFTTTGFILLADGTGTSSVHGGDLSGNVALTAIGFDADIFSNINQAMISAAGGRVTLDAGRDVVAGTAGTNFNNDVLATGAIAIRAGRDFVLDGTSDIRTGAFGGVAGGAIDIAAGRNIELSNSTGGLQTIQAFQGDVTLTAGPGGAFIENAAFPGAIQTNRDIVLSADTVLMNSGGLNTTGIGSVTIRPVTSGRAIDIGGALDGSAVLALSDAEFDLMFTLNVVIGGASTGPVEFSGTITPFIVSDLQVRSATEILVNAAIAFDGTLALRAGDNLFFTPSGSFTSATGGFTGLVDQAQSDSGAGGLGSLGGAISTPVPTRLTGNGDNDTLLGGAGADLLNGLAGNDTLQGNDGNDVLTGGLGSDAMAGGIGDDTYYVDAAGDTVTEAPGAGIDVVRAQVDHVLAENVEELILGGAARDGTGNAIANTLRGSGSNNTLTGLGGADTLRGGGGRDTLRGGTGEDLIDGGVGKDTLIGGADRDVFQFRDGDMGATRPLADLISDFSQALNEKIHLGLVDANTVAGGNQAFAWIGTGAFTGAAGQLRYAHQAGNTYVEGDTDGNGSADFAIALTGTLTLAASDFVL